MMTPPQMNTTRQCSSAMRRWFRPAGGHPGYGRLSRALEDEELDPVDGGVGVTVGQSWARTTPLGTDDLNALIRTVRAGLTRRTVTPGLVTGGMKSPDCSPSRVDGPIAVLIVGDTPPRRCPA